MSNLQEIKDLVSIRAVADYLGLEEEYGKRKFPGERTASIQLYKDNRFHDFGRNVNGDIFDLKGISAEAREDILVQAFLTCPNISEISKKTKIPRPTIYTVIHSDSFQRKYSEARNEAVTGAIAYLQGKLGECAAVLVNTATDTEVPAQIRVNAANAALSQCSQWTKNVDVIERLKAMEELMSQVEQEQKSQRRRT